MNDEEAFLCGVLERPDEETTRAVFADWLEEQGQGGGIIFFYNAFDVGNTHLYRFVYGPTLVAISTVFRPSHGSARTVWRCRPLASFRTEAEDPAVPTWRTLVARRCLTIDSWAKVKALALAAPGCGDHIPGETWYHHVLWDRNTAVEATWNGTDASGYPTQAALIAAYHSLIALAELLPTQIEGADQR